VCETEIFSFFNMETDIFFMQQDEFKTPTEYILKQRKKSLQHNLQETKKEIKKIQNRTRINQSNLSILLTEVCVLP